MKQPPAPPGVPTPGRVRSALASLAQQKPSAGAAQVQRRKHDGRVLYAKASPKDARAHAQAVRRLPCRYCGAPGRGPCAAAGGAEAARVHAVRVDDAWDVVLGRAGWAAVLKRGPVRRA